MQKAQIKSTGYLKPIPSKIRMFPKQEITDFGYAIELWTSAYHSGVRIVPDDDGFVYQSVIGNMTRLFLSGQFGWFGTLEPVIPDPWIVVGAETFTKEIRLFFHDRGAPDQIKRLLGHILVLDGEFAEAAAFAASQCGRLDSILVPGGRIPLWRANTSEDPVPSKTRMRPFVLGGISALNFT